MHTYFFDCNFAPMRKVILQGIEHQSYKSVWDYQESLLQQKIKAKQTGSASPDYLLFVEHDPVYTLGKNGKENNLLINQKALEEKGIEFYHINRGGDITFH